MTEHDDTPGDAALSRRYREAGEQAGMAPPSALDAHILAAARAAVELPPVPAPASPWWRRLTLPVGVMASTLLAVMLALTMQRHTPETLEREQAKPKASAAAAGGASQPDVTSQPLPAPAAERAGSAARVPAEIAERAKRSEQAPAAAEKKALPQAVIPVKPVVPVAPAAATVPAAAPAPAAVTAPAAFPAASNEAASVPPGVKTESAADRALAPEAGSMRQKAAVSAAAPARLDAAKGGAIPAVQVWLDEIRELKRQGREEEAARRLAEFRKAYPEYLLPEDLR